MEVREVSALNEKYSSLKMVNNRLIGIRIPPLGSIIVFTTREYEPEILSKA